MIACFRLNGQQQRFISQALLLDRTATEEAIEKFVTRLTLEGGQQGGGYGTLTPSTAQKLGIYEGNEDLFDNEKGGVYGGTTIGQRAVTNAKKFVPELMKIIDDLNSGTLKTKEIVRLQMADITDETFARSSHCPYIIIH